jgi:hypothetical protein
MKQLTIMPCSRCGAEPVDCFHDSSAQVYVIRCEINCGHIVARRTRAEAIAVWNAKR